MVGKSVPFIWKLTSQSRYLPPANVVCEGYVFTGVCPRGGGLSQHALQVSQHALQQGGAIPACIAGGIPACLAVGGGGSPPGRGQEAWSWGVCSRGVDFCCGLLLCPSVMVFWFGGLLIEGGLLVWSSRGWPSVIAFCCGLLLCPSVMAFWFGGLLIEDGLLVWSSWGWPSVMAFCCGLLLCPSVMAFWFGGLLIEGGLLVWSSGGTTPEGHHTRRP